MNQLIVEQAVAAVEAARRQPGGVKEHMAQARSQVIHALHQGGVPVDEDEIEVALEHEMTRQGDPNTVTASGGVGGSAGGTGGYLAQRWFRGRVGPYTPSKGTSSVVVVPLTKQKPLGNFLPTPKPLGDKLPV